MGAGLRLGGDPVPVTENPDRLAPILTAAPDGSGVSIGTHKSIRNGGRPSQRSATKSLQMTYKSVTAHGFERRGALIVVAGRVGGEAEGLQTPLETPLHEPVAKALEQF
jgi:hypothetical protein